MPAEAINRGSTLSDSRPAKGETQLELLVAAQEQSLLIGATYSLHIGGKAQ